MYVVSIKGKHVFRGSEIICTITKISNLDKESNLKHYLPSFTSLTTDQDSLLEKLLSSRIRVS